MGNKQVLIIRLIVIYQMSYESIRDSNEEFDNRIITKKEIKPVLEINLKPVTTLLTITCFVMFIITLLAPITVQWLSFNKYNLIKNPLVIVTNAFIHANITHLLFNTAALFFLGTVLEINYNKKMVITIFFASVIASNISFLLLFPNNSSIGLSGFIYGLIGFLMVSKPSLKILMPMGFISIPTPIIIAGPVIGFIEFALSFTIADGVAHIAHFSGFITGVILGLTNIKNLKKLF